MSDPTPDRFLRVGALARQTGLSVRTLHHYDAVGLLVPSARTAAGHRRYSAADVARLQQIVSLRALGLSLGAIRDALDEDGPTTRAVLEQHLAHLRAQVARQQHLADRLERLSAHLDHTGGASVEDLLHLTRLTTMIEQHYTPEQRAYLETRRAEVGDARIREVQQEWAALFAALDEHREAGTDPAAPALRPFAEKAEALIAEFTGGDAGIRESLSTAAQSDASAMRSSWGITVELGAYYGRVMAAHHADSGP
ncbi:MAG: MerR family transcriptional regulator [Rubricoccaceae bacterium]|nr:MerR family transcriptional regulator [Rubricoccaceae bacterium]